jgi:hypothetical protein
MTPMLPPPTTPDAANDNAALDYANYAPILPKVKPPTKKPIYCCQRDAATHTTHQ